MEICGQFSILRKSASMQVKETTHGGHQRTANLPTTNQKVVRSRWQILSSLNLRCRSSGLLGLCLRFESLGFLLNILPEPLGRALQISFRYDVVALKNRSGLVA
jgi:hypothetical protein